MWLSLISAGRAGEHGEEGADAPLWRRTANASAVIGRLRHKLLTGGRRGTVAAWVAVSAVPMLALLAVALDVAQLSLADVELQSTADAAALAGAMRYNAVGTSYPSVCGSSGNLQSCAAASAAADVGEINGVTPGTRSWNNTSQVLTDGRLTASILAGPVNSSDTALKVSITRNVGAVLPQIAGGPSSFADTALAIAELESASGGGGQPCIAALNGYGHGVTTQIDIGISGSANITMNGCTMRSNEEITLSGSLNLAAAGLYAGSSVNKSGSINLGTTPVYPDSGQISDPYAGNAAIQNAFSQLATQSGRAWSSSNISPGAYQSISISGSNNITFPAGLYLVSGNVSISGSTTVNGTGVTIVVGGSVSISGSTTLNLSAPVSGASSGIPPFVLAGNSTKSVGVSGSTQGGLSGVVYFPDAAMTFSGSASGTTSNQCLELIADSVTISGSATLGAANCAHYGATSFGSLPPVITPVLVQ